MTVRGRVEDEACREALAAAKVGPPASTCADVTLVTTSARLLSTRISPAQSAGRVSGLRRVPDGAHGGEEAGGQIWRDRDGI